MLSNVAVGIGALFAADRASALSDIPFYDDRSTMATKVRTRSLIRDAAFERVRSPLRACMYVDA